MYPHYAKLLSALTNPKRIEIVRVLSNSCITVSDLVRMTGMTQSNISQHMQVLRREGIVITKRKGKTILYCLSHQNFVKILDNIHEVLSDRKKIKPLTKHLRIPHTLPIIDSVCGMKVSPRHAVFTHEYKRTTYYFCASGCKKTFKQNPRKYV